MGTVNASLPQKVVACQSLLLQLRLAAEHLGPPLATAAHHPTHSLSTRVLPSQGRNSSGCDIPSPDLNPVSQAGERL